MKQLEFNFERKNKYFDTDIKGDYLKIFCKYMYSENITLIKTKKTTVKELVYMFARIGILEHREFRNLLNYFYDKGKFHKRII